MCVCIFSRVWLFLTPWTVAHQAPLSMGFPRREYWSGLTFPPPGDLPNSRMEPESPALADGFTESLGKPLVKMLCCAQSLSHVWVFATPWTVACQAFLSLGILHERILEWIVMPSSKGSSQPRDWTQVSHIADGFFTIWATIEAQEYWCG